MWREKNKEMLMGRYEEIRLYNRVIVLLTNDELNTKLTPPSVSRVEYCQLSCEIRLSEIASFSCWLCWTKYIHPYYSIFILPTSSVSENSGQVREYCLRTKLNYENSHSLSQSSASVCFYHLILTRKWWMVVCCICL